MAFPKDSERHIRQRDPEEVVISLREVADQALAILEAGQGVGAIQESLLRLESARQTFVARGLSDYAKDCADLVDKLNNALTNQDSTAKDEVIEKLHQFAAGG